MRGFLIRRAYFALLSLIAATMIVFGLSRVYGDPLLVYTQEGGGYGLSDEQKEEISRYLGLDKPLIVQYLVWIGNSIRGDFGKTLLDRAPVYGLIKGKLGATVQLAIAAWAFAVVTGVPLGVLSATRRGGALDYLGRTFALFGQALPQFWIAIMAIVIF
ncbi:MAG: ABC transporter permease [Dehalococcoidia bacterium]|nr:ABC transporter permease [Dehalococcoidia bacterium]